ncbi:hypothetical protein F4809DRAFT_641297 [Biscogniauxia mediterranea]|nr:hypothetical protein F4809DRAFT_641297 [Biscogniauxia mediterranea]
MEQEDMIIQRIRQEERERARREVREQLEEARCREEEAEPGVRLVHMLFLSMIRPSLKALGTYNVVHNDVHKQNLLWCQETDRVMVIDLEPC